MKYIIIGGVAGGATAAARLRRVDEKSDILLFEKGKYISYGIADSQSQLLVACDYLERWSSSIALQPDLRSAR